jgi:VIT1/CCC1 family predicted Fe2+/Mn2+ transporter
VWLASVDNTAQLTPHAASEAIGILAPLIPYLFVGRSILIGTETSVILSGGVLFLIGVYEAKTTVGSLWKSCFQMAIIGLTAGLAGFLMGHFIGGLPCLNVLKKMV